MPRTRSKRGVAREAEGRAPQGRETLCTPEVTAKVAEAIRAGNYKVVSAAYGGIAERTFYEWVARGEAGEEPYVQFVQAVKSAEAEAEVRDVAIVARAAERQWQAAAWKLERSHPERWGRRLGLDGGAPGVPIATTVNLSALTDDELDALAAISAKVQASIADGAAEDPDSVAAAVLGDA